MKKTLLVIVILLAAFLRLYKLGSYPALNADEAAIGYNAYSLLQTGKDEHGNAWPIHFQSFNDYKPGLYFYLVMPFVKILGLNEWSVRLPNAIVGIATVYLIYIFVVELFKKESTGNGEQFNEPLLALISAFMLAVSPWHLHFSRGGWEANVATFLMLLGTYLLVRALKDSGYRFFFLSVTSFVLALYTYHSARIVSPLLLTGILLTFYKQTKLHLKPVFVSFVLGIVLIVPLVRDFAKGEVISRASGVGLFADVGPIEKTNEQRMEHLGTFSVILHNKVTNYGLAFLKNWGSHYHGLFLFISGDVIQRNAVPETGQMYLYEIITVLAGLYFVIKTYKQRPKVYNLILGWLFVAPIPAALTFQSPHALRAENMAVPLTIVSALGGYFLIGRIMYSRRVLKRAFIIIAILFVSWNIARYLHMYYAHMSKEYPFSSQYGVKELVEYLSKQKRDFKNIVVTNKYDQPYILFLFYTKYLPSEFQKQHVLTLRDKYGFSTVSDYSNYIFKTIDWDKDKLLYPDSLIIGADEEIPDGTNVVEKIYGSNGYLYFKVVAN